MTFVAYLWGAAGVVALAPAAYLGLLALLARRGSAPQGGAPGVFFDVIVPAHDEEAGLGATLESLERLDYPRALRRIVVVADNCTDGTADVARSHGVDVIERMDPARRGKGYALNLAFGQTLRAGPADVPRAVAVVDADTVVSENLLAAFDARIREGALAMQAEYGVRNRDESWRTRLTDLAFTLFHGVRSLGRRRLGLSAGLRGNGMAFTAQALAQCPFEAGSVVEDVEYGLELGLAGIPVTYVPEAQVLGEMPADGQSSGAQRTRWEAGRRLLRRRYLARLIGEAVRRRDRVLLDLAIDLLVPPLAQLGAGVGLGLAVSLALAPWGGLSVVTPWVLASGAIAIYLLRGLQLSGQGLGGVRVLAAAPAYLAWKLALRPAARTRQAMEWTRTARKGEAR